MLAKLHFIKWPFWDETHRVGTGLRLAKEGRQSLEKKRKLINGDKC